METDRFPRGHDLVDHDVAAGGSFQSARDARIDGDAKSGGGFCRGHLFVRVGPRPGSFYGATPSDQLESRVWVQLATSVVSVVDGDGYRLDHFAGGLGFGNIIDQTHGPVPCGRRPATVRANVANRHSARSGDFPGPPGHRYRPARCPLC